jgi:purine-binding chemotaxis protein CheW
MGGQARGPRTNAVLEDAAPAEGDALKLVGFRIEDWRFAIRLEQVQTAIMPCPITRVFHMPDFVLGIISLRGTMVGVLDLGRLLGMTGGSGGGFRRLLVVSGRGIQAAIPVHDVFRIPDVAAGLVAPIPASVPPAFKAYLEGVINTTALPGCTAAEGEATITLVDVSAIFDSPAVRALTGLP